MTIFVDELRLVIGESVYGAASSFTPPSTAFGSGPPVHTATGALVAEEATSSGSGIRTANAEGDLSADSHVIVGAASKASVGSGDLDSDVAILSGFGFLVPAGTDVVAWGAAPSGPPTAQSATVFGLATRIITASATLTADSVVMTGEVWRNPVYATGSLLTDAGDLDGDAARVIAVSADILSTAATLDASGYVLPSLDVYEDVLIVDECSVTAAADLLERVGLAEYAVETLTWGSVESAQLQTELLGFTQSLTLLSENVVVAEILQLVAKMVVAENVGVEEALPEGVYRYTSLIDGIRASSSVVQQYTIGVVTGVLAGAAALLAPHNEVEESVDMSDAALWTMDVAAWVTETAALSDGVGQSLRLAFITSSDLSLQSLVTAGASFTESLVETLSFVGSLELEDAAGTRVTWVVHPEIPAATTYNNYTFNSFATQNGTLLGARADGIYELAGDDDAGVDVAAVVRTGLLELGGGALKQVTRAYLGYTSDGRLVLKTVVTDGGEKTERWHELTETAGAPREARVKFGKGVKARYWQFELRNADGADFHLDQLQLLPLTLSRRVKE